MKPSLKYEREPHPKNNFWASDCQRLEIDLNLSLNGVEETNKTEWNDTLRMSAGKGVEMQMLQILKDNGIVNKDYNQEKDGRIEVQISEKVKMTGNIDAISQKSVMKLENIQMPQTVELELNDGEPIEVKSINNKNSVDIQKYIDGKPKENYVGQLANYMHALGKTRGHLFVASIDGHNTFWFTCDKQADGTYKCGNTVVDITKEHQRWANVVSRLDKEPNWFEEIYKLPIDQIDWTKLSVSKIGDVRNGRYVVGSEGKWRIDYSPYKDLILEKQGVKAGYSPEELELIRTLTAGFSSKKKV